MKTQRTKWFAHSNYVTDKESFRFADDGSRHGDTPNWVLQADTAENASLIAAAPEMLDMLYTVLPYIEEAQNDPAYKSGAVAKITKQLKALIDKAEGKTND